MSNSSLRRFGAERLSRFALLSGVAFWTVMGAPALAQSAPAPEADSETAETVVIEGRRPLAESEAASLEIQREADSVVSVLSSDAIGNLPDQNIAFAVGRLPGIGIERDQGQARYINLRGTPNYWATLSFDGLSVVSPEGRATRLDNIPSALSKQVIVTKAITPNLPGDTVAGNVNVITRSAMDYDGFHVNTKFGLGLVTLGNGEEVDVSGVVSHRFLDGRLGVLAEGSYYRRNMVTDNWETDPYLTNTDANGVLFAREHENKIYRLTRENQSLAFRVDYQFSDDHTVFWNNTWTNYTDEELRNNYIFRLDQGRAADGTAYTSATSGNTGFAGTSFGARINQNTNSLESEEDTYLSTFGGEHALAGWDLSWRANYAYAADGRDAPATPSWQSPSTVTLRPSVVYNFNDPENHTIQLYRTLQTGSVRSLGLASFSIDDFPTEFQNISKRKGGDETQAYTLKFDAGKEFEIAGMPVEIDTGFMYTDRTKKSSEESYTATRAQLVAAGLAVPEITATGPTAAYNALFLNKSYLGELPTNYAFRYHSKSRLEQFMQDLIDRGVATKNNTTGNYWRVGETIVAGYGMAKVDLGFGNIVFGARVEQTTNEGSAFVTVSGASRLVTVESDDTAVYPSAHFNWDLNEEMKLRVGVAASASRPDFDDLRPNFTINDAAQTISGGNPEATNEKQLGLDVAYEWYMTPEGFFSAGLFYKDIQDVLFTQTSDFGLDVLNTPGFDRSGYDFSRLANGGDGYVAGLELFFSSTAQAVVDKAGLPDWLGGFGVRGSATFTDSEVDIGGNKVALPGTSSGVYNAQLTFEKYNLSMRLAYQFRDAWVQSGNVGSATYWDDDEEIDFSMRYSFSENLEWFFDASNIGNAAAIRYVGAKIYPIEHETFGERYMMGVRFNY